MTANGQRIFIRKMLTSYVHIKKYSWKLTFLVTPKLALPVIVGNISMNKMKIILDFYHSEMRFTFDKFTAVPFQDTGYQNKVNLNYILEKPVHLSDEQQMKLEKTLQQFDDVLTNKIGHVKRYKYAIQLKNNIPVRKNPFPLPPPKAHEMENHIKDLLEQGIIKRCISPYAAPAFLVKKKDGTNRLCIDYLE